jgi:hypothetical protein
MADLLTIAENGIRAEQELRSLPSGAEPNVNSAVHRAALLKMAYQGRLAREAALSRPAAEDYLDPRAQNLRKIHREEEDRRIKEGLENGTHVISKYAQEGIAANDRSISVINDPRREGGKLTPEEADTARARELASNTGLRRTARPLNPEDYPNRPGADVERAIARMSPEQAKVLGGLVVSDGKSPPRMLDGADRFLAFAMAPENVQAEGGKAEKSAKKSPEEEQAELEDFLAENATGKIPTVKRGSKKYFLLGPEEEFIDEATGKKLIRGYQSVEGKHPVIQNLTDGGKLLWKFNTRTGEWDMHPLSRGATAEERTARDEKKNQEWDRRFKATTEKSWELRKDAQEFQSEQFDKKQKAIHERQAIVDKTALDRHDKALKIEWQKTKNAWDVKREGLFKNQKEQLTDKAYSGDWTIQQQGQDSRMPTHDEIEKEAWRQIDEKYPKNAFGNSYKEYFGLEEKKTGVKQGQQPAPAQAPAPVPKQAPAGEPASVKPAEQPTAAEGPPSVSSKEELAKLIGAGTLKKGDTFLYNGKPWTVK